MTSERERLSITGLSLGTYKIRERIGAGGMATVYRGVQTSLNRDVAIKVLPTHFSADATFVERFKQEAISVASLRHPNILSVFDYGEQNGIIYMVTEYVAGGEIGPAADIYAFGVLLFEMLTGSVPFSAETPVAIILAHLHQPPPAPR